MLDIDHHRDVNIISQAAEHVNAECYGRHKSIEEKSNTCYTVITLSNLRLEMIVRFKLLRYCFLLSPDGTIKLQGGLQSSIKET